MARCWTRLSYSSLSSAISFMIFFSSRAARPMISSLAVVVSAIFRGILGTVRDLFPRRWKAIVGSLVLAGEPSSKESSSMPSLVSAMVPERALLAIDFCDWDFFMLLLVSSEIMPFFDLALAPEELLMPLLNSRFCSKRVMPSLYLLPQLESAMSGNWIHIHRRKKYVEQTSMSSLAANGASLLLPSSVTMTTLPFSSRSRSSVWGRIRTERPEGLPVFGSTSSSR
mmetsp:Transcript_25256/g.52464  ORF Transcript_25256/g.52464 Transcript_25256/m.52464 type:complete len:226 (-) Transcript_25256:534-1211(-)